MLRDRLGLTPVLKSQVAPTAGREATARGPGGAL